jgi:hypothetical protein
MQLTSDQAANLLGITGGALRQIELNRKPASGFLASRASRLYKIPRRELLRSDDAPQEEPKPKPEPKKKPEPKVEPTAPPRRKNGKGPGRDAARGAA